MPKLSQTVDEFLSHLESKRRAKGTIALRRGALKQLMLVAGDIETARVEPHHVDKLFAANLHWSAGMSNNVLSSLMVFFKWCRFRRYMHRDSDPTFGWDWWEYTPPEKMRIPSAEWSRLFGAAENEIETICLATGLFLFLRGSEQKRIQLKHIHLNRPKPVIEIYRVKKKEWATLPLSSQLIPYFNRHLTWMAVQGAVHPEHYFIPSKTLPQTREKGRFVKGTGVLNPEKPIVQPADAVQAVLARAGYPTYFEGEHTLRRSGARAYFDTLVDQGYDGALRRVQFMLGHKNSTMTETYLGITLDKHLVMKEVAGLPMFPELENAKIVPLRGVM